EMMVTWVTPSGGRELDQVAGASGQAGPQFGEQLIHGLNMTLGGCLRPGPEFLSRKVPQGLRVTGKVECLRPDPWPEGGLVRGGLAHSRTFLPRLCWRRKNRCAGARGSHGHRRSHRFIA